MSRLLLFAFYCIYLLGKCNSTRILDIDFNSEQFYMHKTAQFYEGPSTIPDVIIRRGTYFDFRVDLDSPYNGERVDIFLTFPTAYDKFVITLPSSKQGSWRIEETNYQNAINVRVTIPGNAPVGVWKVSLILRNRFGQALQQIAVPNRLILLFNPWSKVDSVYMADDQKLKEYVLNERGVIFRTQSVHNAGSPWLFNQFKEGILDAVLFVLNKSKLTSVQRGDPVMVAKQLKILVNDNGYDIRGVLKGQWRGPYDYYEGRRATSPTDWTGSAPILLQYYRSGGVPVAYGQCWVYSGVMTTMFRALGIPARPITTFMSGIDKNTDLTIDRFYDANGFLDFNRSDSYWNFHVWVEAWMSRYNDLGRSYSMWQELDGTPQTVRGGYIQNGPAPTTAVKSSQIDKNFDSDIIYSEVNADLVVWRNNQIEFIRTNAIGTAIWTKAIGSGAIDDITSNYKPVEGSIEERISYQRAANVKNVKPASLYRYRAKKKTMSIKLVVDKHVNIGSSVKIQVRVHNPSFKARIVNIGVKVTSIYYTGDEGNVILEKSIKNVQIQPLKGITLEFILSAKDYIDKLKEFYTTRVEAVVITADGQWTHAEQNLEFMTPSLHITAPKKVNVNDIFFINAEFTNPLNRSLEKCYMIFEGERIDRKIVNLQNVAANEKVNVQLKIKAKFPRNETISFVFVSKSLNQIHGSANIEIRGNGLNSGVFNGIQIPLSNINNPDVSMVSLVHEISTLG